MFFFRHLINNYPHITPSPQNPLPKPKTILDDFLEKFPNARLLSDGSPDVCCARLGYVIQTCMMIDGESCKECWNRLLEVRE